jgi:uncharacterized protein YegL
MTRANLTSINVIIDRSGSMSSLQNDTIGSFNSFLAEQQVVPGECLFTLCTFNQDYNLVHDCIKIADVPQLSTKTYRPDGNTALLDAFGTTIDQVGAKLAAMPEDQRPDKVLFLVITDGQENSSHRYTAAQIKSMVEHQRSKYAWEFVFIGANVDAFAVGTSMGFTASNSVGYEASAAGTNSLYSSVSSNTTAYRSSTSSLSPDFFGQTGITPTGPAQSTTLVAPLVDAAGNPITPAVTTTTPTTK